MELEKETERKEKESRYVTRVRKTLPTQFLGRRGAGEMNKTREQSNFGSKENKKEENSERVYTHTHTHATAVQATKPHTSLNCLGMRLVTALSRSFSLLPPLHLPPSSHLD
jgi:hypothetical protein